jgi:hypothetical protein
MKAVHPELSVASEELTLNLLDLLSRLANNLGAPSQILALLRKRIQPFENVLQLGVRLDDGARPKLLGVPGAGGVRLQLSGLDQQPASLLLVTVQQLVQNGLNLTALGGVVPENMLKSGNVLARDLLSSVEVGTPAQPVEALPVASIRGLDAPSSQGAAEI